MHGSLVLPVWLKFPTEAIGRRLIRGTGRWVQTRAEPPVDARVGTRLDDRVSNGADHGQAQGSRVVPRPARWRARPDSLEAFLFRVET